MKQLELESSTGPIDESLVADYESVIGARLPESYRKFLLETNGGVPSAKNNCFPISDNSEFLPEINAVWIDSFFELCGVVRPALSLIQVFEMTRGRIPHGTIPIATDDYGNLFLLGVSGHLRDKLFFWDHETEGFEPPQDPFHNVCGLSDSFDSFLNSLVEKDAVPPYEG